eukprot:TRINITY_DN34460_c0_g1_i1.p1 TRINITY_DN34460_c0_g1~~TRINITY_DN34460_c0_g1_i1.p1  ORF type:complete len:289 (-),score=52.15 TRINITY_DN34460_c0_g1_i1:255-1070(-)
MVSLSRVCHPEQSGYMETPDIPMHCFCACWWGVASLMVFVFFILGISSWAANEKELEDIKSSRQLECMLSVQPGTPDVHAVIDTARCNKKDVQYRYTEIRCNVMIQQVNVGGSSKEVPAKVYAETDLNSNMDVDAVCKSVLAKKWPNIEIGDWWCGKKHAVSIIMNCVPQVAWVSANFACGGGLADNKKLQCVVDQYQKLRMGNLQQLVYQAGTNLGETKTAVLTLGSVLLLLQCCVWGCCYRACSLIREIDKRQSTDGNLGVILMGSSRE